MPHRGVALLAAVPEEPWPESSTAANGSPAVSLIAPETNTAEQGDAQQEHQPSSLAGVPKARHGPSNDSLHLPAIQAKSASSMSCKAQGAAAQQQKGNVNDQQHSAAWPAPQSPTGIKPTSSCTPTTPTAASPITMQTMPSIPQQYQNSTGLPVAQQKQILQRTETCNLSNEVFLLGRRSNFAKSPSGSSGGRRSVRLRQQQQDVEEEMEDPFLAQRRLHQLPGYKDLCTTELEEAAGQRIMALPYVICKAANGQLYKVATGHVQQMMLRRHLAKLGVELTEQEEAMLTAGVREASHSTPTSPTAPRSRSKRTSIYNPAVTTSRTNSVSTLPGDRPSFAGYSSTGAAPGDVDGGGAAESPGGSLTAPTAGKVTGRIARRASLMPGHLGGQRRSAIGVALDAHAAEDSVRAAQQQVLLDDDLLTRINRLDLFVDNWRNQLAQDAAAAKAAKTSQAAAAAAAEAAAMAAAVISGDGSPRKGSMRRHRQQQHAAAGLPAAKGPGGWGAVRSVVQLNVDNWAQQQAAAARWKNPAWRPTWDDVILQGSLYIKRHGGEGAAVYEAHCAELGITPINQVIQQLENEVANMAHCKIGGAGAPALAAALAANRCINALILRNNGLDGKAVALILAGIATATAAHMTDGARQQNINFAGSSLATIGSAMHAASIVQPPYSIDGRRNSYAYQQDGVSSSINSARRAHGRPHSLQISFETTNREADDQEIVHGSRQGNSQSSEQRALGRLMTSASGSNGPLNSGSGATLSVADGSETAQMHSQGLVQSSAMRLLAQQQDLNGADSMQQQGGRHLGNVSFLHTPRQPKDAVGQVVTDEPAVPAITAAQLAPAATAADEPASRPVLEAHTPTHRPPAFVGSMHSASNGYGLAQQGPEAQLSGYAEMLGLDTQLDGMSMSGQAASGSSSSNPAEQAALWNGLSQIPSTTSMSNKSTSRLTVASGSTRQEQSSSSWPSAAVSTNSSSRVQGSTASKEFVTIYSGMSELDLGHNPLGIVGAKAVADLLNSAQHPGQFLVSLNLSKCNIPEAGGLAIAASLQAGNLKLRRLSLSNNALGNKSAIAFGELLESSHTLKELDLSWNQIKAEGARGLACGLAANATLSQLILCWNGLETSGGAALGDMLALNMGLKLLDLSHCRLGPEACLMLGEGIKSNVVLEVLLLAGNDIGEDGARHLMTALAANRNLKYMGLNGSNMTAAVHDSGGSPADFNPASPDGNYTLELSIAAERAVAVQLAELDRSSTTDLMKSITLDGKVNTSAKKANWPAQLPSRGRLTCTFISIGLKRPMGVMDNAKLGTLQKQLQAKRMNDREKLELVAMFAPFALFTCEQIASIVAALSIGPERVAAAALLFTRAADSASDLAALTSALSSHDLLGWRGVLGWYEGYRWNQPTGHYELNLALPVHSAIAARLKDDAQGSPEGPCWLNLMHDLASTCRKQPQGNGPPGDWRSLIPNTGTISLDYVSTFPPGATAATTAWGITAASSTTPASLGCSGKKGAAVAADGAVAAAANEATAAAITDEQLSVLIKDQIIGPLAAETAGSTPAATAAISDPAAADKALLVLRQAAATGILLQSAQVCALVKCFVLSPHRVEVAVVCWPVTLDRADNYWTVLYALQGMEQSNLLQRLGPWRLYNPQHASCHWVLDLSNPGHEEVAKKLVAQAVAGGELPNFWNIRVRGVKKQVNENQNMWGMLTAVSFTPFLEFDFLGADAWGAVGKTDKKVAALQPGDKLEMRAKQAARLDAIRAKQLYPYSPDGSSYKRQPWANYHTLMSPQLGKSPWLAAWDRLMRVLLRLDIQAEGRSRGSSALRDVFEEAAASRQMAAARTTTGHRRPDAYAGTAAAAAEDSADEDSAAEDGFQSEGGIQEDEATDEENLCMTAPEFEELLRAWGYNKLEIQHYLQLMERTLTAACEAAAAATSMAEPGSAAPSRGTWASSAAGKSCSRAAAAKPIGSDADSSDAVASSMDKNSSKGAEDVSSSMAGSGRAPSMTGAAAGAATVTAGSSKKGAHAAAAAAAGAGCRQEATTTATPGSNQQVSALAANLQTSFDRGITFDEFVNIIMAEPPKSLRFKDVVNSMTALLGSLGTAGKAGGSLSRVSKGKPQQAADAAAARVSDAGGHKQSINGAA